MTKNTLTDLNEYLLALLCRAWRSMAEVREHLSAYEDIGITPQEIQEKLDKLAEYEKAESEGKKPTLPCAIGDTVYSLVGYRYARNKDKPYPCKIVYIGMNEKYMMFNAIFDDVNLNMFQFVQSDFGKTVFFTRKEAEQALERLNANE